MVIGMIWQFVLSVIVLKNELGTFTLQGLKERLRLNHPVRADGSVFKRAYFLTVPIILYAFAMEQTGWFSFLEEAINRAFPFFAPPSYSLIQNLAVPEFRGAWYILVLAVVSCIFNYLLGEELFFRGVLLPGMNKAFGKWDWVINGVLFASYHIHKISEIPLFIIGSFFIAFLNKRYRSFWPSVIIHGVEAIPLLISVFWVVLFI